MIFGLQKIHTSALKGLIDLPGDFLLCIPAISSSDNVYQRMLQNTISLQNARKVLIFFKISTFDLICKSLKVNSKL